MSRSENIAVFESYLHGLASKDLSSVPFAPAITSEGPLMPKLAGRETIVGFLTSIFPFIKGVEIKQQIVNGDYGATVFDMETVNGVDHVVDLCRVVGGQLTEVRAFYYPNQILSSRAHSMREKSPKHSSSRPRLRPGLSTKALVHLVG